MRTRAAIACVWLGLVVQGGHAAEQQFPSKPIRVIVPTTPAGATDALARQMAPGLTKLWGQQIVVDNRPGGHGAIAMEMVARSYPDGHTLLLGNVGTIAINVGLYPKLPYDTLADFLPVSLLVKQPFLLVINPAVPASTLSEFIGYARNRPGKILYGSGGNGSGTHVAMEMLKRQTGIDLVHVPYRGGGPAITELLGGQIQTHLNGANSLLGLIRSGKLRGLAVSHPHRLAVAPDIPTFQEEGVSGFITSQWSGMLAPAKMSPTLLAKISADVSRVMRSDDVQERLAKEGSEVVASSPQQFTHYLRAEIKMWGETIRHANVRVD